MSEQPRTFGGRYEIDRILGRGGMAEVYLGHDARLGRKVAVKVLRSDLARDASFQERFRREAQSAGSLNHPSIVAVYDTGEQHEVTATGAEMTIPYIIMEYVQGKTLSELIASHEDIPVTKAADIMLKTLSALGYSHRAGIVHRDIKPSNIMITDAGEVKVMDFGIARAVADSTSQMTQTQAVMGTAQYLSPEQARGEKVDARSDLYSAACVLYELLAGRGPFVGDSPVAIAYQHVREAPPLVSAFNPSVSAALDAVVAKGLAKPRDERYQTADEFAADIRAAMAGRPTLAESGAAVAAAPDADATELMGPVRTDPTAVITPAAAAQTSTIATPQPSPTASGAFEEALSPAPKKKRKAPWIITAVIVVLAAAAAVWWIVARDSNEVTVPELTSSMTQEQAESALTTAGLEADFTTTASDTVAEGYVISSDPASGTQVDEGSTVTVEISGGASTVDVPDVTGKNVDDARKEIEAAGLTWGTATSADTPDAAANVVTSTDPKAGDSVAKGATINVQYASGKVEVPDVSGKNQDEATSALDKQGLGVKVQEQESDQEAGTVIDQDQSAGSLVDQGTVVTITIAKAQESATMKNWVGSDSGTVIATLQAQGYTVNAVEQADDTVPMNAVISTDPAPGEAVEPGATITVTISTGPSDSSSTTTSPSESSSSSSPSESSGGGGGGGNG